MSRPYEMGSGFDSFAPSRRRGGRKWLSYVLIWGVVVLLIVGWWVTRDTFPRWRVVPSSPAFIAVVDQPVANFDRISQSALWDALPPGWEFAAAKEALQRDYGVPPWILRNVIGAQCFVSAENAANLDEAVAITRMSRIGTLVEMAASRLSSRIDRDWAGGLALRHVPNGGFYYAVRGRTFIVSASRDALIRALTLPEEGAMSHEAFMAEVSGGGAEHVRGKAVFDESHPWGSAVQALGFAARIDDAEFTTQINVAFHPDWQERLRPLLARAQSGPLPAPAGTMFDVQADFGLAPGAFVEAVQHAIGDQAGADSWWEAWSTMPDDPEKSFVPFALTRLLDNAGSAYSLGVIGFDLNEMIPVPELFLTLPAGANWEERLAETTGAPWPEGLPAPAVTHDAASGVVSVTMAGGPSLAPSFVARRGDLLLSNSRPIIESMAGQGPKPEQETAHSGNLAIQAKPAECVTALVDYGRLFADVGAIRGHTPQSYEEAAAAWQTWAGRIGEISAVAARNDGGISLKTRVVLAE